MKTYFLSGQGIDMYFHYFFSPLQKPKQPTWVFIFNEHRLGVYWDLLQKFKTVNMSNLLWRTSLNSFVNSCMKTHPYTLVSIQTHLSMHVCMCFSGSQGAQVTELKEIIWSVFSQTTWKIWLRQGSCLHGHQGRVKIFQPI